MIHYICLFDSIKNGLIASVNDGALDKYKFYQLCENIYNYSPEDFRKNLSVRIEFSDHSSIMPLHDFILIRNI